MFSILNEIKDNSPFRTTSVVTASIGSAASIYVLVAVTGYLSFGDNIMGNIVAQYTPSVASTIGRAAIVILVMFSYPLQVHPCRASVDAVSKWRPASWKRNGSEEFTPASGSPSRSSLLPSNGKKVAVRSKTEDMSELRFAIITTAIIILSYIVAMTVSSLDKVLAYVGSTGSTSISFILPGLFYYKISSPDSPHHQRLLKDEDDEEYDGSGDEQSPISPVGASSWRDAWSKKAKGRQWRQVVLRRLSLAIAVYGVLVMVVCLVINTFFIVAH
jgi:amino acid permease